jgi:phosphoserine phosphatase RsbU/P
MTRDRTQIVGAGLALLVLVLLVLLDASVPPQYAILTGLFGLAPLIACAVVPAAGTAGIASLAVLAAALSGSWNDTWGTPQHNIRLLNVFLVGAAAVTIAAVRVHREDRFVQVSQIAEVAQRAILPVLPEHAGHVAIAARYQSAAQGALVGGDLYDCYHSDRHVRILVGDVRGKGITGVEQAARVTRAFRQSAPLRATLAEVAEEMDDYLAGFFDDEEFATALLVDVSDPGVLRLVSAGHPAPQLVRESEARVLDLPIGRVLGLDLQAADPYAETTVPWSPGDRLLVYTDGLSEARDSDGEFFPVESLDAAVRLGSVERAVEEVVAAVRSYVPRGRLEDDLAVVVIGHLPDAEPSDGVRRRPGGREAGAAGDAGGKLTAFRTAICGPARPPPPRPTRPPAPPSQRMPAGRFRS